MPELIGWMPFVSDEWQSEQRTVSISRPGQLQFRVSVINIVNYYKGAMSMLIHWSQHWAKVQASTRCSVFFPIPEGRAFQTEIFR